MIADIPYFMHGRAQDNASQAAATIRALAERRGLVVAPLQEAMRTRGWIAMFTDYAADWFHPTTAATRRGHRHSGPCSSHESQAGEHTQGKPHSAGWPRMKAPDDRSDLRR